MRRRTIDEIVHTPVGLLSEEEISLLDPEAQKFARNYQAQKLREMACPRHERIETATREQSNRGLHYCKCKHCGKDMSWDSSD